MAGETSHPQFPTSRRRVVRRTLLAVTVTGLACVLFSASVLAVPEGAPPPPAAPDPSALFNTAVGAFERGEYQNAINAISDLFKQIPADLPPADKTKLAAQLEPIYFTLGAAYFNLKQYPQAITALKDYLARYPKGARVNDATFSLAQSNFFAKEYAEAAQVFATLENVPAVREQALMLEGLAYKENKDDAKAIDGV